MDQAEIFAILNHHVFATEKAYLIRNIAENPERFVGVFRSTTPRLKLTQNLLQSREIRFGDALEVVVRRILESIGFENLPRTITPVDGKPMDLDQYVTTLTQDHFYLIEQKVRDDHDSSKKTGQIENFRHKLRHLKTQHGDKLVGIMWFIDPLLSKNKPYYNNELQSLSAELQIPIYLFYNGEFFDYLTGSTAEWELLAKALLIWRDNVPKDVNLDCDSPDDLEELLKVQPLVWYKLVANDQLWSSGVVSVVFPKGTNLKEVSLQLAQTPLLKFSIGKKRVSYKELAILIRERVINWYDLTYELPHDSEGLLL
jgi:hypothetical protein